MMKTRGMVRREKEEEAQMMKEKKRWMKRLHKARLVKLDAEIWKHLPDDLIETVVMKVHLLRRPKCRLVCKRWNSIICYQPPNVDPLRHHVLQIVHFNLLLSPHSHVWNC